MPATTSFPFTLRVEDLGRLAEAEVELRPMTLFVGENNSGKSYLATLFWTAFRPERNAELQFRSVDPDLLEACEAAQMLIDDSVARARRGESGVGTETQRPWHRRRVSRGKFGTSKQVSTSISPEIVFSYAVDLQRDERWVTWAVRMAERMMPARLRSALGTAHVQAKVRLSDSGWAAPSLTIQVFLGDDQRRLSAAVDVQDVFVFVGENSVDAGRFLAQILLDKVILSDYWTLPRGVDDPHGALYFPASRTAFLQNLPELTDRQLEHSFQQVSERATQMVAPVRQFLRFLVNPGELRPDDKGLAALIEGKIIGGSFQRGPGIDYQYTPVGLATPLPMHLTSSVVTELLPLWLLVSTGRRPPLLVYEEPEAHLHPRLQRVVAVLLARLARQGTKVLVTTHSETFAQQINNLIKRSGLDPETRAATAVDFPYEADDYLSPDDVAGYEFRFRDDGRSYTERLEVRPDGIVMPMFNKELLALTDEAIRLDEALATKQAGG